MKLGISSYCLDREIEQGRMTLAEAIDWAAAHGAQCMELVPFAFRFDDPATGKIDTQAIAQVKSRRAMRELNCAIILCWPICAARARRSGPRSTA